MSVQTRATKLGYGVFKCIGLGIKERGVRGVLKQLSAMGEIKLGTLKGMDEHGNCYYENLKYQFGKCIFRWRHRWVEYAGWNWRFDISQVSPAWYAWLTSEYDETPEEQAILLKKKCEDISKIATLGNSSCPYKTNMGGVVAPHEENLTNHKYRSYKRWGFKDPKEQDQYWIPETHPYYMGQARKIPQEAEAWNPKSASA